MKYRYLFASDMDFTLLMPGEDVTEENKKAIRLLRENGVAFTLATGRTFYLVRKFAASLDVDVPCITSNGGSLYDPKKFDEVYSVNIDEAVARDVFEMLLRRDIDFAGYSGEGIFFGPRNGRRDFFDKYNEGLKEEEVLYMGDDIPDYEAMSRCGLPACPADAAPEIRDIAHYISPMCGGMGCVRDVIEQVLRLHGQWFHPDAVVW